LGWHASQEPFSNEDVWVDGVKETHTVLDASEEIRNEAHLCH